MFVCNTMYVVSKLGCPIQYKIVMNLTVFFAKHLVYTIFHLLLIQYLNYFWGKNIKDWVLAEQVVSIASYSLLSDQPKPKTLSSTHTRFQIHTKCFGNMSQLHDIFGLQRDA